MAKTIALISGKGGCGKTTLSLCIANLLSKSGLKVLLIDSDMATNGATYFYEGALNNKENFSSIFKAISNENNFDNFVELTESLCFIPAYLQENENLNSYYFSEELYPLFKYNFHKFFEKVTNKFDVILFDCQAGFSQLTNMILEVSDFILAVMEADAISSAALRNLYLKLDHKVLENKKIYQIFNKVTQEEYEIYSKVSGGTIFTNLVAIKFDWAIRKAFALSEVPEMDKTNGNFGEQLYNICMCFYNNVFHNESLKTFLAKFKSDMEMKSLLAKKESIANELEVLQKKKRDSSYRLYKNLYLFLVPTLLAILFISLCFTLGTKYEWSFIATVIVSMLSCILVFINLLDIIKQRQSQFGDIQKKQREYEKIEIELLKRGLCR